MTTAEIELAANKGNLATADFDVGQALRYQIIPQFLEDVGPCSWRKAYKQITTIATRQTYALASNALKIHEAYRAIPGGKPVQLDYIGEDPLKVAQAEIAVTPAPPTGYYMALTGSDLEGSGVVTFGAILDGEIGTNTIGLTGAVVGSNVAPGWPVDLPAGLIGLMRVSAPDTIEVRLHNMSGSTVTPGDVAVSFSVFSGPQAAAVELSGSGTVAGGDILDGEIRQLTFALAGATVGANVSPGWPSGLPAGLIGMMRVSASGIIQVRLLNMSGGLVTLPTLTYAASIIGTVSSPAAAWQNLKLRAPADAVYTLVVCQLTYVPFGDTTTTVNMAPYIPAQYHWGLVEGLRAQIFFDRFGQSDPRYAQAQAQYMIWVQRAQVNRELGRRGNLVLSVR